MKHYKQYMVYKSMSIKVYLVDGWRVYDGIWKFVSLQSDIKAGRDNENMFQIWHYFSIIVLEVFVQK